MKQVYNTEIKIIIHLKDKSQKEIVTNENIYWKLKYGTLPLPLYKEIPIKEFNQYELKKYYPLIGETGRLYDRTYTMFLYGYGPYKRYYHDEIEKIVIEENYIEKDIEKLSIDRLQKDLGFRGYSELLFDRFEELTEKKEREHLAKLLKIRAGI